MRSHWYWRQTQACPESSHEHPLLSQSSFAPQVPVFLRTLVASRVVTEIGPAKVPQTCWLPSTVMSEVDVHPHPDPKTLVLSAVSDLL